jgi:predicted transcriptional regulator
MFRLVRNNDIPAEEFATSLALLGFRNINKPGFFHPAPEGRMFDSGPKPTPDQQYDIVAYRAAVANGNIEAADRLLKYLTNSGFVIQLNDAGVMYVGNRTSAGMAELEKNIEAKISERNAARRVKNFKVADRIRDELAANGIVLKDTKDGTTWEIAR